MNIFANKKIWKRIAIIIGIIAIIGVVFPKPSNAGIGGMLMTAIMDLLMGIADGAQTLMHKLFIKQDVVIYFISEGSGFLHIFKFIVIGLAAIALGVVSTSLIITGAVITVALMIFGYGNVMFSTVKAINANMLKDDTISLPYINITPYEIFTNESGLFSVDFFSEREAKTDSDENIIMLNQTISDWYATLRLISIVGMMSVLVYMGIRILLASTSESAAKYKKMLWDWVVATFLIFTMQYIMVFSNFLVNTLTDTIATLKIPLTITGSDANKKTVQVSKEGVEGYIIGANFDGQNITLDTDTSKLVKQAYKQLVNDSQGENQSDFENLFYQDANLSAVAQSESDAKVLFWPADNFVTQARMNAQFVRSAKGTELADYIGYGLIYICLTIYTCVFLFVYIRRYVYMVFLTLISPLVALTYPIDKVKDSTAQAFNFWFREYLYNLLLQPLHLLLYMLLIGSAMKFATTNPIYVIICLGFMLPAEKLLKAMFGFKGQTPGAMPGLAAGALMMTAARNIFNNGSKGSVGSSGNGKNSSGDNNLNAIPIRRPSNFYENPDPGTSGGTPGDDSGGTSEGDSEEASGGTPGGSSGGTPGGSSGGTPGGSSGGTPGGSSGGTPRGSSGGTPGGSSGGTPRGSSSGSGSTTRHKLPRWMRETGGDALKFAGEKLGDGAKTAGKGVVGVGVGALGATVGGIAGIVSGDPSKAFENMTALGVAGYTIGSRNAGGAVDKAAGVIDKGVDAAKNAYYNRNPEKYDQKVNDEISKNIRRDKDKIGYLKRNIDKDDYKDFVKSGGGLEQYIDMGHSDLKDMVTMEKIRKEKGWGADSAGRRKAADLHKSYMDYYEGLNGKDRDKFVEKVKREMHNKNKGWSNEQINSSFKNTEDLLNRYHTIRKETR